MSKRKWRMLKVGDVRPEGYQYRSIDVWEDGDRVGVVVTHDDLVFNELRAPVSDTPDGYVVSNTCAEDDGFARWWIDGDLPACATCPGEPDGERDCQRCKDVARFAWMARAALDKK